MTFSDWAIILLVLVSFFVCYRIVQFVILIERLSPSRYLSKRKPDAVPELGHVGADEAQEMINSLGDWVRNQKPDYLLGVHFSGLMISAKIASDLGFDQARVAYSENRKDRLDPPTIYSRNDVILGGRVCIVDDISRQGLTLRQVANSIFSDFQKGLNRISQTCYGVCILVETPIKSQIGFFLPDKILQSTTEENIIFPWTSLVERTRSAFRQHQDGKEIDEPDAFRDYQEMVANLEFAAFCIELSLTEPEFYQECLSGSFLDAYRFRMGQPRAA